jgi:phosphatidylglycerophosphatase A
MSAALRPRLAFAVSHPGHFIALGFGAGLAPRGPGTAGTLLGWAIGAVFLRHFPPLVLLACTAPLFLLGVWACGVTGRHLGAHDHGAMVWDEIVAFLAVLSIVPSQPAWQAAAFVAFRAFDIAKPPPIRRLERRWHGGFGVMADDVLAAAYTLVVLAAIRRIFL